MNIPQKRYHRSTVGYRPSTDAYRSYAAGYRWLTPTVSIAFAALPRLHSTHVPHVQPAGVDNLHIMHDPIQNRIRMYAAAKSCDADVVVCRSRNYSMKTGEHHAIAYALLFGMPGVPAVYYGSEWGTEGEKSGGDAALRPAFDAPRKNQLTEWIATLAQARKSSAALTAGNYRNVLLTNRQAIFERAAEGERVLVAVNIDNQPYTAHFDAGCGRAVDLITGRDHDFGGGSELPPYSAFYWKTER